MSNPALAAGPAPGWLGRWKQALAQQIEEGGGRHDEAAIYAGAPGDPGLAGGPDSMSWELHGDLGIVFVAGTGAIIMEVLHPSVMAGVFTQSSYRTDPLKRARNTLGYVLRTTFGTSEAATRVIEGVKRVHSRINGTRPDGVAYRALDPELIAWVHTCIPWAIMTAYDRYRRPLSVEEKNRYLKEQAPIGRMGGADWVPETVDELEAYVERMRPLMSMNEQTREFIAFLAGTTDDYDVPRRERFDRWASIRASMSLMPEWAQELTGTHVPALARRLWLQPADRLKQNVVRWVYPELPCKRMALERVRRAAPAAQPGRLATAAA